MDYIYLDNRQIIFCWSAYEKHIQRLDKDRINIRESEKQFEEDIAKILTSDENLETIIPLIYEANSKNQFINLISEHNKHLSESEMF